MKRQLLSALAALVVMSSGSALATQPNFLSHNPTLRHALAPVDAVIAALATHDAQRIKGLYATDAIVVDNVGSMRWSGPTAGTDWLANVDGQWGKYRAATFTPYAHPAEISFSDAQSAYVVIYGTVTNKAPDHQLLNRGSFTFTLSKASGSWKITSQTFSPLYLGPNEDEPG